MTDPCITTYPSKLRWNLLAPRVEDVRLEDIAHSLAGIPRYNAHTHTLYSVAQHSVFVADVILQRTEDYPAGLPGPVGLPGHSRELAVYALFHDAHEAYLGDTIAPLKAALNSFFVPLGLTCPLEGLEDLHDATIFEAISQVVPSAHARSLVHQADKAAFAVEHPILLDPDASLGPFYQGRILPQAEARDLFLARARSLEVRVG